MIYPFKEPYIRFHVLEKAFKNGGLVFLDTTYTIGEVGNKFKFTIFMSSHKAQKYVANKTIWFAFIWFI